MELLDRYLQAVKKYLPVRRQDDIIAELRANMESQIEDKESELGRLLTQGEMEDLLRKMGSPLKVASRYQPQQYLIGPAIFPMYLYVLRVAILWALIIYSIIVAVILFTSHSAAGVADSLMRTPGVLINVAAWVTLVFAAFEFISSRYPGKCPPIAGFTDNWQPSTLPPLEKNDVSGRKPRSFTLAVAEVVVGFLLIAWLLLIPSHPFLLMGPGVVVLQMAPFQLAPVWWTFYWWIIGLNALQLAWKTLDLARGQWQQPAPIRQIIFKAVGLIPLVLLLSVRDHIYVMLKNPSADQLQYGQNLDVINNGIRLGVSVICAIVVLQLSWEIGRMIWDEYRRREAAR
jgi:HAAS domain-containing protein